MEEATILNHLNLYCNGMLGISEEREIILKKRQSKKSRKTENINTNNTVCNSTNNIGSVNYNNEEAPKNDFNDDKSRKCELSEDGFKIKSSSYELPEDDSNISDAFDSDLNDDDDKSRICELSEDGFKIKSSSYVLPKDDSDISDAFDSDIDEESFNTTMNDSSSQSKSKNKKNYKKLKKPLLKLIDDFGIDEKVFNNSKRSSDMSKKIDDNCKKSVDMKIYDYSQKRGNDNKKRKLNQLTEDSSKEKIQYMDFHRARRDIFKLGMTGFNKKDKESLIEERIVKIGGKLPKKAYTNYKKLMDENKLEKEQELKERENSDNKMFDGSQKKIEKKKKRGPAPHLDPLTGSFKGGMLKLSKKDIKKIQR